MIQNYFVDTKVDAQRNIRFTQILTEGYYLFD